MAELLRFTELMAQTRPARAYELLAQLQQQALSSPERARWLDLALRLAVQLGHTERAKEHAAQMARSPDVREHLKPHLVRLSATLLAINRETKQVKCVAVPGGETRLAELALNAWPAAVIQLQAHAFPPPDVVLVSRDSDSYKGPHGRRIVVGDAIDVKRLRELASEDAKEEVAWEWRRNDPARVLIGVWLARREDVAHWLAHRHTWRSVRDPCEIVAFVPRELAFTEQVPDELALGVRTFRVDGSGDRAHLQSVLRHLRDEPSLRDFDGYLLVTSDCAALCDYLPQPFVKSMVGGDNREPTVIARNVSDLALAPPYGFNRAALTKCAETLGAAPQGSKSKLEAGIALWLACKTVKRLDWGCHLTPATAEPARIEDAVRGSLNGLLAHSLGAGGLAVWSKIRASLLETESASQARASAKLTIVTGLFDIRGRERASLNDPNGECRTANDFIALSRPLLAWNSPMYIVTEERFADGLRKARADMGHAAKTIVEAVKVEDTDYWGLVERLYTLYAIGRVPQRFSPAKDTALYAWCMMQKYDCLRRAMAVNRFASTSIYWVDLGIYHVADPPPSVSGLLRDLSRAKRLRCTLLRHLAPHETENRAQFFSRLQQAVGGGLIGGPCEHVGWLREQIDREARESVKHFPVLDEALLAAVYLDHPDHFLPIWSGHKEMFQPRTPQNVDQLLQRCARADEARDLLAELTDAALRAKVEHWLDRHATKTINVAATEPKSNIVTKSDDPRKSHSVDKSNIVAKSDRLPRADGVAKSYRLPKSDGVAKSDRLPKSDGVATEMRAEMLAERGGTMRVGMCDGGEWFKQTLVIALRKHVGAALDGSQDAQKMPRVSWVLDPPAGDKLDLLLFSQHRTTVAHKRYAGCPKLCVTGEVEWPGYPDAYPCDVQIAAVRPAKAQERLLFVPFHVTSFWERRWHSLRDLIDKPKVPPAAWTKTRFCAFFYENCVPDRERFFDLLSKYKPVDALGRSRNPDRSYRTQDRYVDPPGATLYDTTTARYLPYKFVIAMEPLVRAHWITEKALNGMLAGAIPIYRGAPEIGEFFNPRAFINGSGKTDDEIAAMVRTIDSSSEAYAAMWAEPWLTAEQSQRWFEAPNPSPLSQLLGRVLTQL